MLQRRKILRRLGYSFAGISLIFISYRLLSASDLNTEKVAQIAEAQAAQYPEIATEILISMKTPEISKAELDEEQEFEAPLQELIPNDEQSRMLHDAEEIAISRCMNERGFEYIPNRYFANEELDPWGEAISSGDIKAASEIGYGISAGLDSEGLPLPPDANEDLLAQLDEATQVAWDEAFGGKKPDLSAVPQEGSWVNVEVPGFGTVVWDTESCLSDAQRSVYGNDIEQMKAEVLETQIRKKIDNIVVEDADYQKALQDWQNCMAEKGLTFTYPGEPSVSLRRQFQKGELDRAALVEKEIQIATQDAQCFQSAKLDIAQREAERRADAEVREKYAEEIKRLKSSLDTALARTEQLLSANNNE